LRVRSAHRSSSSYGGRSRGRPGHLRSTSRRRYVLRRRSCPSSSSRNAVLEGAEVPSMVEGKGEAACMRGPSRTTLACCATVGSSRFSFFPLVRLAYRTLLSHSRSLLILLRYGPSSLACSLNRLLLLLAPFLPFFPPWVLYQVLHSLYSPLSFSGYTWTPHVRFSPIQAKKLMR
jgi:hypothetical protein